MRAGQRPLLAGAGGDPAATPAARPAPPPAKPQIVNAAARPWGGETIVHRPALPHIPVHGTQGLSYQEALTRHCWAAHTWVGHGSTATSAPRPQRETRAEEGPATQRWRRTCRSSTSARHSRTARASASPEDPALPVSGSARARSARGTRAAASRRAYTVHVHISMSCPAARILHNGAFCGCKQT